MNSKPVANLLPNIGDSSIIIKKNYENCWFLL